MSWGNKLVLVFVVFAALIGTLVYKCTQKNFELVTPQYYNDELKYQDKIDGANNANKLTSVFLTQTPADMRITLPKELKGQATTGEILFYCASNSANDRTIKLDVSDDGVMIIDKSKLAPVPYQVKISWQIGTTRYYNEQTVAVK